MCAGSKRAADKSPALKTIYFVVVRPNESDQPVAAPMPHTKRRKPQNGS